MDSATSSRGSNTEHAGGSLNRAVNPGRSRVYGTISQAGRRRVSSVDPKRKSKESAAGSERQSGVGSGELVVMKPVERFDPEG